MDEYNKLKISNTIWKRFFGMIHFHEFLIELRSSVLKFDLIIFLPPHVLDGKTNEFKDNLTK